MEHEEEINVEYNILYPVHLLGYIYYQLMIQDKYTVALYHLD